ncbi:MAG: error-prone DNA polymerase [Betaproteobacteria bacterium]|nr:error-prone DNA polymerase [Betaproteobacteria bacterium]
MSLSAYAELHCVSNFTFLRGASHPEELVERAAALGYAALALTDECSVAGVVRAHGAAKQAGLKLILGTEIRLAEGLRLVLLATDREGYGNLSHLITRGRRNAVKGSYRLVREDFEDGLPGCLALWLPDTEPDPGQAQWLRDLFPGRGWIAAELLRGPDDHGRLRALQELSRRTRLPLTAAGDVHMHLRSRRVLQDVLTAIRLRTSVREAGHALHPNGARHLRRRETLARLYPPELLAESVAIAERCCFSLDSLRYEYPDELVPPETTPAAHLRALVEKGLQERFTPTPSLPPQGGGSNASDAPAAGCAGPSLHPQGGGRDAPSSLVGEGREGGMPPKVRQLIDHELALIAELGYEPYFLTVHDIVRFARSRGILCQGRGSAANSAVCYALGITEVDPSRMEMLFERFVSKERNEPPDIDVDFEHERREEVIQYLYEKYGRERAALAATVITYRPRSAVRDVGKALGLELAQVDRLAKSLAWWDDWPRLGAAEQPSAGADSGPRQETLSHSPEAPLPAPGSERREAGGRKVLTERLRDAGVDPGSPVVRQLIFLVHTLAGFPRHLSQHVGGFVISRGELSRLVPIENAAMEDRTVIQWDKDDLDTLGLLKVDVLGLGMLSCIRRALDLVSDWRAKPPSPPAPLPGAGEGRFVCGGPASEPPRKFTMATIPAEDPQVYDMISRADTMGVFQVESRAQMAMLPRMRPRNFYDLVIEVAIVRPGPIQGGMVHPYLRRRQGLEPVTYPSEAVKAVLSRTLGVPIFQEQVMSLAVVAAGFTPGEADQLRRSMAAWRRKGGLEKFEARLIEGMRSRGYAEDFARQIFRQIQGFGEYGFPESHAASFALLVYVSAWLKCHEPAAFCCALVNSQPMGFYAPSQLIQDARRHGVEVQSVDVMASEWDCMLEPSPSPSMGEGRDGGHALLPTPALRLGLRLVKGLSRAGAERIVAARARGAFENTGDLAHRAQLDRRDLECLAAAGALASLAGHRRKARWEVTGIETLPPLLQGTGFEETPIELPAPTEGEDLVADYASLGLTLGRHPLALLRSNLKQRRLLTAVELHALPHRSSARAAGIVTCRQHPDTASGVTFLTLEDETGYVNVVVWRDLAEKQRRELLCSRLLAVDGVLEREGEVVHLIAGRLADYTGLLGSLVTRSRDFH